MKSLTHISFVPGSISKFISCSSNAFLMLFQHLYALRYSEKYTLFISKFLQKRVYCFILVHIFCLLANKLINDIYKTGEWQTSVLAIDYIISLLNQSSNTLSARNIPSFSMVIISLSTKLFFIRSIFDLLPRGYISETA